MRSSTRCRDDNTARQGMKFTGLDSRDAEVNPLDPATDGLWMHVFNRRWFDVGHDFRDAFDILGDADDFFFQIRVR